MNKQLKHHEQESVRRAEACITVTELVGSAIIYSQGQK